ncbi:YceD family protein [Aestuariivirga litoralis]|uniref:YceD family protein n=1 Tax=Aestuariivirga litoralis TaxID=2650924 RepID=UPI0018C610CA|nr:DUF177 domain-containing protein [Aestuariivirga litoralis]MBG1231792.1 DUF177 domain-containing protein [Aestuariivirga litoralis]
MTSKKITSVEFSRPLIVDRVPRKGSHEVFEADETERTRLATRFALPQLHKLSARLLAMPWRGGGLKVTGTVEADVTRVSVVSLEEFRQTTSFQVERFFLTANKIDESIEDDADPIVNGEVDLGEIVSEALGLELDPYPRKPGEVFAAEPENP